MFFSFSGYPEPAARRCGVRLPYRLMWECGGPANSTVVLPSDAGGQEGLQAIEKNEKEKNMFV
jgi:hypothetical protein